MVYVTDVDPENNMSIECSGVEEMDKYAKACREQGYKVVTKVKPVVSEFVGGADASDGFTVNTRIKLLMCPRCNGFLNETTVHRGVCSGCGQLIEWGEGQV